MANLQPLGPRRRAEYEAKGLNPDDFRYDVDLGDFVPYKPTEEVPRAASIGASFAQPIAELPAGAGRGIAQASMDLAGAVPDFMSRAAYGSTLPAVLGGKLVSGLTQPIVARLKEVPRYDGTAETLAGVGGSILGGLGIAAIPGAGIPLLTSMYGTKRYGDIRAEGGNPLTAATGGAIDAAAVAAPPLRAVGMPIKEALIKGGLLGGAVNTGQQLAQNVLERATFNPDQPLGEGLGTAGLTGVGLGAGTSGLQARATQSVSKPPMLNMGGSDNLTGQVQRTPQELFAENLRILNTKGLDQAKYAAAQKAVQEFDPNITPDELIRMTPYVNRVDPAQWIKDVRGDSARMAEYGDPVVKTVAKLLNDGYPLTDADMTMVMSTPENQLGVVVKALKTKHGAAAAEAARVREAEAEALKVQEAKAKEQAALEAKTQKALVGLVSDADAITSLQQRAASQNIPLPETFTTPKELEAYIKGEERGLEAARKGREAAQKKQQEAEAKSRADLSAERDAIAAIQQQAKTLGVELPTDYKTPKELQQWLNAYTKEIQLTQKGRPMVPEDTKSAAQSALVMSKEGVPGLDPVNAVKLAEQSVTDVPGAATTVTADAPPVQKAGQRIRGKAVRQQIIPPPEPAKAAPADQPIPDSPASIEAQFKATVDLAGTKSVTLLVPGTPLARIPDGLDTVNTKHGIAVFNPKKITREQVIAAGAGDNFDGTVLGYSVATKAPAETPTVAVTTKTEGTTEALSAAVPGTPEAVVKEAAAQKAAVPEGTQSVRPVEEVVKDRVETNGAEPTPAQADALTKLPAEESINAEQIAKLNKVLETPAKPPVKGPDVPETTPTKAGEPIVKKPAKRVIRKDEKTGEPAPAGSTGAKPGGMGAGLKEKMDAKKSGVQEGGFVNLAGVEDMIKRLKRRWAVTHRVGKAGIQRVEDTPGGKEVADPLRKLFEEHDILNNKGQHTLAAALKGGSKEDARAAEQFRRDMYRTGSSAVKLTPVQQRIVDSMNELALYTRYKANKEGAWINDNGTYRPGEYNQYYSPQFFRDEVWQGIKDNDDGLRKELVAQFKSEGRTPEEANEVFNSLGREKSMVSGDTVDFGPLRRPEGVNFPEAWLKGPQDSWVSYIHKWAADIAASKHLEQNPAIANLRGDLSDSRGGTHKADPTYADNIPLANAVRRVIKSYALSLAPNLTNTDKLNAIASGLTVQHQSGSYDILGSLATTWSHADTVSTAKALLQTLTPGSFERGRAKGYSSTFHKANAEQANIFMGKGLLDRTVKFFDAAKQWTGLHDMQEFTKLISAFAGENAARKALAEGNKKFFDRLKMEDPFGRPADEVIAEAANRTQKEVTSSYDVRDLPDYLVTGSSNQFSRLTLGLARYAIGQTNRQLNYVTKSIQQGDPRPLVKMALGGLVGVEMLDYVMEELTNKKPNDLTWAEWFRLDQPESARFITGKLARANLGGFATTLASTLLNWGSGVKAYPPKPQALDMGIATWDNLQHMINKFNEEGLDGRDFLTISHEFLKDTVQDYRLGAKAFETPNRLREQGIYRRIEGGDRNSVDLPSANPLSTNTRFNRAETPEEVSRLEPIVMERGYQGKPVPSIQNSLQDPEFYDWLNKLQPGQGSEAYEQDLGKQRGINVMKKQVTDRARDLQKASQKGKPKFDDKGRIKFR